MSFDPSTIKGIILAGVAAVILTLAFNAGYGLACLSWRGVPPPEVLREMRAGAPYLVLGLFVAAVGAILGARLAAYRPEKSQRWTGLVAGAGLALLVIGVGLARGRLDFWLPPNAAMAAAGGWLGGWLAGRAQTT
jgi:hypothetical protein